MTNENNSSGTLLREFSERADFCNPKRPCQRAVARGSEAGIKPKPDPIVAYYNILSTGILIWKSEDLAPHTTFAEFATEAQAWPKLWFDPHGLV